MVGECNVAADALSRSHLTVLDTPAPVHATLPALPAPVPMPMPLVVDLAPIPTAGSGPMFAVPTHMRAMAVYVHDRMPRSPFPDLEIVR
eukprot:6126730-Karenia_brevis.AAC.1